MKFEKIYNIVQVITYEHGLTIECPIKACLNEQLANDYANTLNDFELEFPHRQNRYYYVTGVYVSSDVIIDDEIEYMQDRMAHAQQEREAARRVLAEHSQLTAND